VPFLLVPMLLSFVASLTNYAPFQTAIMTRFVGLENYSRLLGEDTFRTALLNVSWLTLLTVSAELVLGFAIASLLRTPFRGRAVLRFVLLVPWLTSPAASGIMWHAMFDMRSGMVNYFPALFGLPRLPYALSVDGAFAAVVATEIWRKTPLVTFLLLPGLLAVPADQWDQATLDGLGIIPKVRHVVFPRLRTLGLTIMLLMVGESLGTSESVFFLTGGGPGSRTMTPGIYSYNQAIQGQNWARAATSGWYIVMLVLMVGAGYLYAARQEA
jgi:multiple sugar transport system permease protein